MAIPIIHPVLKDLTLPAIALNGNIVKFVNSARNLGVIYDSKMNFDTHLNSIIRTAGYRLANISRQRSFMSRSHLRKTIETTIIYPMMYGSAAWGSINKKQIKKLQYIQNWAAKLINGLKKYDGCRHVLDEMRWLDITGLIKLKHTCVSFAASKGWIGSELQDLFTTNNRPNQTRYQTTKYFRTKTTRTAGGERGISAFGPRRLNEILPLVQELEDPKLLRKGAMEAYFEKQHKKYLEDQHGKSSKK
jgi:hypothetical protein